MALACTGNQQGLLHVSFNQDNTCLALATRDGLRIYSIDTHQIVYRNAIGALGLAEMLFCTSLVAYVGAGEQPALTPRKLTVVNTCSEVAIQHISFASSVLAVRMNRQRLVVVLERRTNVYALQSLEHLRSLETAPNPRGLAALTPAAEPGDPCLLALPSSSTVGTLQVYDLAADGGNALVEISAHKAPLAAVAWSQDGSLLATASSTGTVVRVHAIQPGASRIFSFRRGSTAATVHCLAFSPPGVEPRLLAAASSHGTVHLFRLEAAERHPAMAAASMAAGLLSAVVKLPVTDMVDPVRNIATVRLPCHGAASICALQRPSSGGGEGGGASTGSLSASHAFGGAISLLVATSEGLLYEYAIEGLANPRGPSCSLAGEWALLGSAGLETLVASDERRKFNGPLPPTGIKNTQLVTIKEGKLWALRQDFPEEGAKSIWLNCSVAKLQSGGLLVYAPVAPTPEMLDQVASLPGRVEHIVAPSLSPEHWLYVNAFASHHPDATVWVCPGLTEVNLPGIGDAKISAGPNVKEIGPAMTQALGDEVDFALFVGPLGLFKEAVLCAKHAGAVFSGDLFFGAFEEEGMPTPLQQKIGDLVGIRKRVGCPVAFLQMLLKRDAAREWLGKVGGWEFDTVTGGHLSAGINAERYGVDARASLLESFKFVL